MMSEPFSFEVMQRHFEQVWREGKMIPESVTIAEADYEALLKSLIPRREYTDFERELLGEDGVAELEYRQSPKDISHILNHVNAGMVRVNRSPHLPSGKISFGYRLTSF